MTNPYAAPKAPITDSIATDSIDYERMDAVASGQRILIYTFIAALLSGGLRAQVDPVLSLVVALAIAAVSIYGAVRVDKGLGGSLFSRIVYAIAMLLPLVSLIIMITLSMRATKVLRAAGYQVGLLGAKKRS